MDGDIIQLTESIVSQRTVDIVIEADGMEGHPDEQGVPQGSRMSLIIFANNTS
jgi:hypothetical protein